MDYSFHSFRGREHKCYSLAQVSINHVLKLDLLHFANVELETVSNAKFDCGHGEFGSLIALNKEKEKIG